MTGMRCKVMSDLDLHFYVVNGKEFLFNDCAHMVYKMSSDNQVLNFLFSNNDKKEYDLLCSVLHTG